jgi:AraC-like DNA-binding protein
VIYLTKGKFFGEIEKKLEYNGLICSNTFTDINDAPWHCHENVHFTYFINGNVREIDKKNSYVCTNHTLIFHNSQDPHYNQHGSLTHSLNLEMNTSWLNKYQIPLNVLHGSTFITNPCLLKLFPKVYKEIIHPDNVSHLSIEGLALQAIAMLQRSNKKLYIPDPKWVRKIKDILQEGQTLYKLDYIAKEVNMHPTYLSQVFPKYFKCSFGEYVRTAKLQKATVLLANKKFSMVEISYECGFSDQSHFIRSFKEYYLMTPLQYRKSILNY